MAGQTIFFSPDSYLTTIAMIAEQALVAHHVVCAAEAPPETTAPPAVPQIHDLAIFDP